MRHFFIYLHNSYDSYDEGPSCIKANSPEEAAIQWAKERSDDCKNSYKLEVIEGFPTKVVTVIRRPSPWVVSNVD